MRMKTWLLTLKSRNHSVSFPSTRHPCAIVQILVLFVALFCFRIEAINALNAAENEILPHSPKSPAFQESCPAHQRNNASVEIKLTAKCLLEARHVSGTQDVEHDLFPSWTNFTLFAVGQEFARKNIGYLGISHFFALIFENFIPDIKDILITTGSSNTMSRAVKRYTATATQILLWYRNSVMDPQQKEVLLDSLRTVRRLHLDGAFKAVTRLGNGRKKYIDSKQSEILRQLWEQQPRSVVFDERYWTALEMDLKQSSIPEHMRHFPKWEDDGYSGPPISQFAQSLTQFSFVGVPVLFHKELGISHVTRQEFEGFIHTWAVLGHALGIKDEFNICMNGTFEETRKLFKDILQTYFIPAMFQFDWRVRVQLGAYLDALYHMDQVITPRLITYRFLRDVVKINPQNLLRQFTIMERMYLALVDSLMSNNLDANRFILNRGGMFFLDVNGYNSFGQHYSSEARKSRGAFYTREKVVF